MELKRDEIIKALECCKSFRDLNDCDVCPYFQSELEDDESCTNRMAQDALSLIKELTEENERLRAENEIKSQKRANIFEISNAFDRGRTKGVQKMQEILCDGRVSNDPVVIAANVAAEEMLEGTNAQD